MPAAPRSDTNKPSKPTLPRDPAPQLHPPTSAATRTAADLQEAAVRLIHGSSTPPRLDHASVVSHLAPALVSDDRLSSFPPTGTQHAMLFAVPVPSESDPSKYVTAFLRSTDPALQPSDSRRFGIFPTDGGRVGNHHAGASVFQHVAGVSAPT